MTKRNPPQLQVSVISGCYEAPEGEELPLS
jgi:hypothetical protein